MPYKKNAEVLDEAIDAWIPLWVGLTTFAVRKLKLLLKMHKSCFKYSCQNLKVRFEVSLLALVLGSDLSYSC